MTPETFFVDAVQLANAYTVADLVVTGTLLAGGYKVYDRYVGGDE